MVEVALPDLVVSEKAVAKDLSRSYGTGVYHAQASGPGLFFKQKREKAPNNQKNP